MVVPVLGTGMESLLFSFGGGSLCGYMAARALRVIAKSAAVIIGAFILGISFLAYRGWIDIHWQAIENQTQAMAFNASAQVLNTINDTASKFAAPSLTAEATPICAAIGFTSGFFLGVRH